MAASGCRANRAARGATPSYSTGILMRIGFSRASSSATSAVRPATRPMMNTSRPNTGVKPMSCSTAASAPSILIGNGLTTVAMARSIASTNATPSPATPPLARQVEQDGRAGIGRVHAMPETREPLAGGARLGRDRASPPRPARSTPPSLAPRPRRSSPCIPSRRRHGRRRRRECPPRLPPTRIGDCRRARAAPSRTTARRSRDRRRRSGSHRAARARCGFGRRP